jgi:DNA-binding MarR family transcriptional regulator
MDIKSLRAFTRLMETLDPNLTIQQVHILLTVFGSKSLERDGYVPLSDIVDATGHTLASVSRTLVFFGTHLKPNRRTPGLGLIERREDPDNNRKKNLFLTKRGKLVKTQLQEL